MPADTWRLIIKTMHQTTQSVTVPSSASVLQLKDAIRLEFDIANDRQRLIFQGKVLKDGTQLTDYSNLQDGKIIHLVARPADAPTNPVNDEPPTSAPRGSMPQMFPGMFGPSEGYTFITLDANISDLGGSTSALSSLFGGMLGGSSDRNGAMNGPMNTRTQFTFSRPPQNNQTTRNNNAIPPRTTSTLGDWLNRRQPGEFSSLLDNTPSRANSQSLETRLIRTIAALTNIQANVDASPAETDISQFIPSATGSASPGAIRTIRSQLRAGGASDMAQVGYVVNNMSDVLDTMSSRLRQVGQQLQAENASYDQVAPQLQHIVTSIQNLNTVNQFVGDIMGGMAPPTQRRNLRSSTHGLNRQANTTRTTRSNSRRTAQSSTTRQSNAVSSSSSPTKRKTRSTKAANATTSSNKRKTRSASTADSATSSSSSTATSSSSKRQKVNKNNTETGTPTTSSATTRKGKGKRRADDN